MKPIVFITADDKAVGAALTNNFVSATIVDGSGMSADSLNFVVNDKLRNIQIPRKGVELEIKVGYEKGSIKSLGRFSVDDPSITGPVSQLKITARSANMQGELRSPRSRSWDATTVGAIVNTIATAHSLTAKVSEKFAGEAVSHIDQTEESDLHLLTRMANERDAMLKVAQNNVLFIERNKSKSVGGGGLASVNIRGEDVTSYSASFPDRQNYNSVVTMYRDTATAQDVTVTAGAGEPVFNIRFPHSDAATAKIAAEGRLLKLQRGNAMLKLKLPGDNKFLAETPVNIVGLHPSLDGSNWVIKKSTHNVGAGWSCSLELEIKR